MSLVGSVQTAMFVWSAAQKGYSAITAVRSTYETMCWVQGVAQKIARRSVFSKRIREKKNSITDGARR